MQLDRSVSVKLPLQMGTQIFMFMFALDGLFLKSG